MSNCLNCLNVLLSKCMIVLVFQCPFVRMSDSQNDWIPKLSKCQIVWLSKCLIIWMSKVSKSPIVWLSKCLNVQLYEFPIVWMSKYMIVQMPECMIVWISNCQYIQMSECPNVWLSKCMNVQCAPQGPLNKWNSLPPILQYFFNLWGYLVPPVKINLVFC